MYNYKTMYKIHYNIKVVFLIESKLKLLVLNYIVA